MEVVGYFICILALLHSCHSKRKDLLKASEDLLERETKRLAAEKVTCSLKTLGMKSMNNYRINKQPNKAITCLVKYLSSKKDDGWAWSVLGQAYLDSKLQKSTSLSTACFKQASKLSGKVSDFIKDWSFLGPFVIGKIEVDGDPLEAYGGIWNVSASRYKKTVKFYSELIPGGEVTWQSVKQTRSGEELRISPQIDWNQLVNSLGSIAITEWQGWVLGEFAVNDNNQNILIQCLGVHTIYVDRTPVTGDVYRRNQFWFSVALSKGIHTIYIRLRTKAVQTFKCEIKLAASTFEVLQPSFLPDLIDGYLFSTYISLSIANYHSTKWMTDIRISLTSTGSSLKALYQNEHSFSIAPGQICPLIFQLNTDAAIVSYTCSGIIIKVKVSSSEGQQVIPLSLRCRRLGESFLFTFLDHDGSVQHAAAIPPVDGSTGLYPTLLTLHGTTVPPQNQADSYKRMVGGKFVFGFEKAWVLAPTRHGAHNWEGPGALTAMTALEALAELTQNKPWLPQQASSQHVIYAGHSMGGHGAWHLATHFPDRGLALISLAGWIKKEEYGDSNLFFRHDVATSYVDPAIKAVLEACITENDADRLVSNLQGIPVLARIGADDRTVHPFFVRRMYRVLKEWKINVTYTELPGKEHWWWDTWETNDGGAVHDRQLRDFTNDHAALPGGPERYCDNSGTCGEKTEAAANKYTKPISSTPSSFTYTVINPAFGGSMYGLQITLQMVPHRKSTIKCDIIDHQVSLDTTNVASFAIKTDGWRSLPSSAEILIDGQPVKIEEKEAKEEKIKGKVQLCRIDGNWDVCTESQPSLRSPSTQGPARRVAENPFLIVTGSGGDAEINRHIQDLAVYISNLFLLTSDAVAPIIKDNQLTQEVADKFNLIVLGSHNSWTSKLSASVPISQTKDLQLKNCRFSHPRTGALYLTPHAVDRLALVLVGNTIEGLRDVVSLATPTIPPMTRSPFSNLIPDFIITGPDYRSQGPGGYLCAGFWGNNWEFRADLASCSHCI